MFKVGLRVETVEAFSNFNSLWDENRATSSQIIAEQYVKMKWIGL